MEENEWSAVVVFSVHKLEHIFLSRNCPPDIIIILMSKFFTFMKNRMTVNPKMQRKKRLTFYDCIKPMCMVSSVFGLFNYKIEVDVNNQMNAKVGIFNAISFVGYIAINLTLSYFTQHSSRSAANSESTVVLKSDRFFWISGLFMCLSSIFLAMLNRKRFIKILQNVTAFDESVKFNVVFSF